MSYLGNSPANALYNVTAPVTLAAGQTVVPINYTPGRCLFLLNGSIQTLGVDVLATNGSTATLAVAANAGDQLVAINFAAFNVANAVPLVGGPMSGALQLFGGDTVPTPAQFDNSTQVASTAFVQRALGNFAARVVLTANAVLAPSQSGSLIECAGSTAFQITLPAPSTAGLIRFTFYNAATASVTLTTPSGSIFNANVGTASVVMPPAGSFDLVSDGTSWIVLSGAGAASMSTAGYQKLPSGLIVQWGVATCPVQQTTTVTLPMAFPNACLWATGNVGVGITLTSNTLGIGVQGNGTKNTIGISVATAQTSGSTGVDFLAIGY